MSGEQFKMRTGEGGIARDALGNDNRAPKSIL